MTLLVDADQLPGRGRGEADLRRLLLHCGDAEQQVEHHQDPGKVLHGSLQNPAPAVDPLCLASDWGPRDRSGETLFSVPPGTVRRVAPRDPVVKGSSQKRGPVCAGPVEPLPVVEGHGEVHEYSALGRRCLGADSGLGQVPGELLGEAHGAERPALGRGCHPVPGPLDQATTGVEAAEGIAALPDMGGSPVPTLTVIAEEVLDHARKGRGGPPDTLRSGGITPGGRRLRWATGPAPRRGLSWLHGRDLNPRPPGYEPGALAAAPPCGRKRTKFFRNCLAAERWLTGAADGCIMELPRGGTGRRVWGAPRSPRIAGTPLWVHIVTLRAVTSGPGANQAFRVTASSLLRIDPENSQGLHAWRPGPSSSGLTGEGASPRSSAARQTQTMTDRDNRLPVARGRFRAGHRLPLAGRSSSGCHPQPRQQDRILPQAGVPGKGRVLLHPMRRSVSPPPPFPEMRNLWPLLLLSEV